jgi:hypothetical protein
VALKLSPEHIMQVGLGFWGSKTLLRAVELGLFTELDDRPLELGELQRRLQLHPRSGRDFLDALVSLGFLVRKKTGYANTPEASVFLDKRKPSYIGGLLEMANARLYPFWGGLTEGLRTGQPQNEIKHGMTGLFEGLYNDPARLREFLHAMTGLSMGANMAIARKFPWAGYKTFVDVGTAEGGLAVEVAKANRHLAGAGFDLPVVQPHFEAYVQRAGVADRVKFRPGSFFDQPLPNADVVMMGHILHDWNLEQKMMLLEKAYAAIPKGGACIVYEAIIDDKREKNVFGLLMSLNMLIETPGGFDYTGADCSGWMKQVGFKRTRVEHLIGPDSMVVGIK